MAGAAVVVPDVEPELIGPSAATEDEVAPAGEREDGLALPIFDDDGVLIEVVFVHPDDAA